MEVRGGARGPGYPHRSVVTKPRSTPVSLSGIAISYVSRPGAANMGGFGSQKFNLVADSI